jgi:hypothetical protein
VLLRLEQRGRSSRWIAVGFGEQLAHERLGSAADEPAHQIERNRRHSLAAENCVCRERDVLGDIDQHAVEVEDDRFSGVPIDPPRWTPLPGTRGACAHASTS